MIATKHNDPSRGSGVKLGADVIAAPDRIRASIVTEVYAGQATRHLCLVDEFLMQ